jgi:hypothetical protein
MIVGNIATLRPLFRRVLRLGADSQESSSKNTPGNAHSGPIRSHPYKPFDHEHELGAVGGAMRKDNANINIETRIRGGAYTGRESLSSDNESQRQILGGERNGGFYRSKGILVSQEVEIRRS